MEKIEDAMEDVGNQQLRGAGFPRSKSYVGGMGDLEGI